MARLKFLLFALLVLALGLAHLPLLSGPLSAGALGEGTAHAAASAARLSTVADSQRLAVQQLALKLSTSPELGALVRGERGPEGLGALRADMATGLAPALKESAVLALRAEGQLVYLRGAGTPTTVSGSGGGFNAAALSALADEGGSLNAFGALHYFVPVPSPDARGAGTLYVGAPLLPASALESAASGAEAVAFVQGDTLLQRAGNPALTQAALAALRPGQSGVVSRGVIARLGPLKLPLGTEGNGFGGYAPLSVGSRQSLPGTNLEAVAVVSTAPVMGALARYQSSALTALGLLALVSLLWSLLFGPERRAGDEDPRSAGSGDTLGLSMMPMARPQGGYASPTPGGPLSTPAALPPLPTGESASARSGPYPFPSGSLPPHAPTGDPLPGSGPYPFPRGGDPLPGSGPYPFPAAGSGEPASAKSGPYPFPTARPSGQPLPSYSSGALRYESPPPVPEPTPGPQRSVPPPLPPAGGHDYEDQPTAVYTQQQAQDPFALASAPSAAARPAPPAFGYADGSEDNPEATRVALIPQELLLAAARQELEAPAAVPLPAPRAAAPAPQATGPAEDEQHFEEVFHEFIATRERCGEPADGLTYDRFVAKLRKNREQLVQKYACRTVRFQVYVKEGKAALKATPVKD